MVKRVSSEGIQLYLVVTGKCKRGTSARREGVRITDSIDGSDDTAGRYIGTGL
jgi:hypothetical protein